MFDAIAALTPGQGRRALTPDERAEIEDVLDAAAEWAAGRLDWRAVAGLGRMEVNGVPSESYTRFCAVVFTPPSDPRRAALLALVDVLVEAEGYTVTRQGVYTSWELRQNADAVERAKAERAA